MGTGIIDFHSHVLPGMDDGSPDVAATLSMLREMQKQGTETICATSHYYAWEEDIASYLSRRAQSYASLPQGQADIRLGAEVAYFDNICKADRLHSLCLTGTDVLLIEMPFREWPRSALDDLQTLSLDMGYRIVMAHPERFRFSKANREYLHRLADAGFAFQINAETLLSMWTRRDGLELLEMTENPILGTDAHNLDRRRPRMQEARQVIEKRLGEAFLDFIDETTAEYLQP